MPNKYIEVPKPIQLLDPSNGLPVNDAITFSAFAENLIRNHPIFVESYQAVSAAVTILEELKRLGAHKVLKLPDRDWEILKQAIAQPKQMMVQNGQAHVLPGYGYHPAVTPQLLPFLSAVMNAQDALKEPEPG